MKSIKRIQDLLNSKSQLWFDNLCKVVELLSGVAAIASVLSGFLRYNSDFFMFISIHWAGIIFFLLMVLSLVLALKYRNSAINKMKVASIDTKSIIEKTLICIDELSQVEERIDDYNKDDICDCCESLSKELVNTVTRIYVNYAIMLLNHLQRVMKRFIVYDVSYCIKVVINPTERTVFTLARSGNTDPTRVVGANIEAKIDDNSDFEILNRANDMNIHDPYFYESNLDDYNERLKEISNGTQEYKNSNPKWKEHYIATMVVPISRVNGSYAGNVITYGFLCADSKDERAFNQRQKTINIKMMQIYATLFGTVSSKYQLIMQKMAGGKNV